MNVTFSTPPKSGERDRSPKQIELLYEVTRQFASTLELDNVLGKVLSLTVRSVGAAVGSIFLLNKEGRVIRSILARSNLPPEVKYPTVNRVMSHGFAGWVVQQRQAGIIQDTELDKRWYVFPDDTLVARSALAAPLIRRNQVMGVVTMTHPEPNRFTPEQLELLEAIAHQAAVAVEKAFLYTWVNNERSTLKAIIAGVQDAILVTDLEDKIILFNQAAQENLALPPNARGSLLEDIVKEPAILSFYRQSAGQTECPQREVTLEDGRVFECTLAQVANVGNILGMHDVTAFKRLDALKSEFVSQVAHDLKAPLAIIHGYASLLADLPILAEEENVYVQPIINAIIRMRALIDNVLDLGHIEMGLEEDLPVVDIGTIVQNSVAAVESLADERGVTLALELGKETVLARAAAARLEQAVTNLLNNALKFTSAGGEVTVTLSQNNEEVVVSVADTGPGIPQALQTKLFQKFSKLGQRATKKEEGHGLGLAIVKSVVEAHQGRVWLTSEEGKGSVFSFAIPAYKPADSA